MGSLPYLFPRRRARPCAGEAGGAGRGFSRGCGRGIISLPAASVSTRGVVPTGGQWAGWLVGLTRGPRMRGFRSDGWRKVEGVRVRAYGEEIASASVRVKLFVKERGCGTMFLGNVQNCLLYVTLSISYTRRVA